MQLNHVQGLGVRGSRHHCGGGMQHHPRAACAAPTCRATWRAWDTSVATVCTTACAPSDCAEGKPSPEGSGASRSAVEALDNLGTMSKVQQGGQGRGSWSFTPKEFCAKESAAPTGHGFGVGCTFSVHCVGGQWHGHYVQEASQKIETAGNLIRHEIVRLSESCSPSAQVGRRAPCQGAPVAVPLCAFAADLAQEPLPLWLRVHRCHACGAAALPGRADVALPQRHRLLSRSDSGCRQAVADSSGAFCCPPTIACMRQQWLQIQKHARRWRPLPQDALIPKHPPASNSHSSRSEVARCRSARRRSRG